jgi:endonuclease-8
MPEGDTVWRAARTLHEALAGGTLTRAELRVPRYATVPLAGRTVLEVAARGKHLLARMSGGVTVHTHLGMDGRWRVLPAGRGWQGGPPAHQLRAVLCTAEQQALGYRLALVEAVRTSDEARLLARLGPDLLGADWDPDEAVRRLLTRPERPVAEALLDQRNLAGIGNLYKAEVCFLRGVWPWTPMGVVPDPHALVNLAQWLLFENRERVEQVTTGDPRRGQRTWVYGRAGQPCRRCGTPIERTATGSPDADRPAARTIPGREPDRDPQADRVTFHCPHCQPGRRPG